MVVDFEGTPNPTPAPPTNAAPLTKSHTSLLSPFGLLGTAAWFGGGGSDQFESEPSDEDRAAEESARKTVAECKVRGILLIIYKYLKYNSSYII